MPTMWLSDSQSTSQQLCIQETPPILSQHTATLTLPLSSDRNRRRLLQRRRLLLRLRPDPVLRPRPARHGQHPLPHRHHPPPRAPADIRVLRAQEQVERHAGVLGGRAVDSDEVAVDRVCGGDVWDIRAFWGELCRDFGRVMGGVGADEMCVFFFYRSSSRRSRVSRTTSRSWDLIWRADCRLRATRRARTSGRTRICLYSSGGQ